jgi:hypothetical protein
VALPEIARLVEQDDDYHAFLLVRQARARLPLDGALERFWIDRTFPLTVETNPPGAEVLMKPYREGGARWEPLGRTPLKAVRVPLTHLRLRIERDGFEPVEVASDISGPMRARRFTLDEKDKGPKGMVRVPGEAPSSGACRPSRWETSGSTGTKSRTGSTRSSSTGAGTALRSIGSNLSSRAAGPSRGKRP